MSRSNPKTSTSPVKRKYSMNGHVTKGGFMSYYDIQAKEKVKVKTPFTFIVLDTLNSIVGVNVNKGVKTGIWSNQIHDTKTEEFNVRLGNTTSVKGLYEDIKNDLPKGSKFSNQVYIAYKNEDKKLDIGILEIKGASLSSWFELKKQVNIDEVSVVIKSLELHKEEGSDDDEGYYSMVFGKGKITEETNNEAIALDIELQKYFKGASSEESEISEEEKSKSNLDDDGTGVFDNDDEDSDLPF